MPSPFRSPDPRAGNYIKYLPISPLSTRTLVQDIGHRGDIVILALDDLQGAVLSIESSFLPII